MRSRSSRTPAGMPVTMTVSCGPCDSPALTKRKRDIAAILSRRARVAAAVLDFGAQRGERIGLDPGDALRGERALDTLRAADHAADRRHVLDPLPAPDDFGTQAGGRPDEERHAEGGEI